MDKRNLILDAMKTLLGRDMGTSCSVSTIARTAGIGKGSIYYYFKSKDEMFDALMEREYDQIIENCRVLIHGSNADASQKLALLFQSYRSSASMLTMNHYLHQQQNAAIHQKSLAKILLSLSPIGHGWPGSNRTVMKCPLASVRRHWLPERTQCQRPRSILRG